MTEHALNYDKKQKFKITPTHFIFKLFSLADLHKGIFIIILSRFSLLHNYKYLATMFDVPLLSAH